MLHSLYINNFKSIKNWRSSDLKRFNIIVGSSASGKTTFLEAIKTGLSGTPSTLWNTNGLRGNLQMMYYASSSEQFESMWRPYFSGFDTDSEIVIHASGTTASSIVNIKFDRSKSVAIFNHTGPNPENRVQIGNATPLMFKRQNSVGIDNELYCYPSNGALQFDQGPDINDKSEFLSAGSVINGNQAANMFSALSLEDQEHDVVDTLCQLFPILSGISVQAPMGSPPQLYATLKDKSRKLPISNVSSGITKILSLLITIKSFSGGVVLIDEIENGIYYENLTSLWIVLQRFARETNTQVFATTHSQECLMAAARVFSHNTDELTLFRASNNHVGTELVGISGYDAINAIHGGLEVRG